MTSSEKPKGVPQRIGLVYGEAHFTLTRKLLLLTQNLDSQIFLKCLRKASNFKDRK